jgi:hypothetical protein
MKHILLFLLLQNSVIIFSENNIYFDEYKQFIDENYESYILFSKILYPYRINLEEDNNFKIIYLFSIINYNGIIVILNNENMIINAYKFIYKNDTSKFYIGVPINSSLFSIYYHDAESILNNIINVDFKLMQGKDVENNME